jgi:hypothetical protein
MIDGAQEALEELQKLQDSVKPFDTPTAVRYIESELGGPLGQFFTEISEEPIASASLAQVPYPLAFKLTCLEGRGERLVQTTHQH